MSGGKKKSGPKHWLQSAKSVFKGHGRSSSSHSGVKTSGTSAPAAASTPLVASPPVAAPSSVAASPPVASGSVIGLPSGSSAHGSNNLTPTGSAIISGAPPIQLFPSGQTQPTVAGNLGTNPQGSGGLPTTNLTPTHPPPDPNKDVITSIHVTIAEIKSAQQALEDKKWYYTDRHGRQVDVGERMRRILKSVESCAKIMDVAIQHHPEISSLVWAGARFILMVSQISGGYWCIYLQINF